MRTRQRGSSDFLFPGVSIGPYSSFASVNVCNFTTPEKGEVSETEHEVPKGKTVSCSSAATKEASFSERKTVLFRDMHVLNLIATNDWGLLGGFHAAKKSPLCIVT